jgi:predicted DsbA family dithiol-disulfide isomerase
MNKVTVEFFHDVICSFCFPMSYRMRQLQKIMPEVEIVHRSFALVKTESDFDQMFGSRAAAKDEILSHWEHANQNDDLHRFNISGMRRADFLFPASMKALIACKAAFFTDGDAGYWDVFDALQDALFVQNRNIGAQDVLEDVVSETKIDFEQWKRRYDDAGTREAVEKDLLLADQYGIHSVPSLVINGTHLVSGAQPLTQIIHAIHALAEEADQPVGKGLS